MGLGFLVGAALISTAATVYQIEEQKEMAREQEKKAEEEAKIQDRSEELQRLSNLEEEKQAKRISPPVLGADTPAGVEALQVGNSPSVTTGIQIGTTGSTTGGIQI